MQELLIAAGGGGDAIASFLLATPTPGRRVAIATWAWDRLMIDPLPGPRSIEDFDDLENPAANVFVFKPFTRPRPPAGSTLPRLAAELDVDLVFLDPSKGCRQLSDQIKSAAAWCGADRITVVDVGGDVLGQPGDPGLRSPLADITTLVAADDSDVPAELVVIGLGCDGELDAQLLRRRLNHLKAEVLPVIGLERIQQIITVLEWHPSEATSLVAAAALGYRGRVEIRDKGLPVELTDDTATAWRVPVHVALPPSPITEAISTTASLEALEEVFRETYQVDEIDYERRKARSASLAEPSTPVDVTELLRDACGRGSRWVTRRRLREALGENPENFNKLLLVPTAPPYS